MQSISIAINLVRPNWHWVCRVGVRDLHIIDVVELDFATNLRFCFRCESC